eukprot:gene18043-biopygen10287
MWIHLVLLRTLALLRDWAFCVGFGAEVAPHDSLMASGYLLFRKIYCSGKSTVPEILLFRKIYYCSGKSTVPSASEGRSTGGVRPSPRAVRIHSRSQAFDQIPKPPDPEVADSRSHAVGQNPEAAESRSRQIPKLRRSRSHRFPKLRVSQRFPKPPIPEVAESRSYADPEAVQTPHTRAPRSWVMSHVRVPFGCYRPPHSKSDLGVSPRGPPPRRPPARLREAGAKSMWTHFVLLRTLALLRDWAFCVGFGVELRDSATSGIGGFGNLGETLGFGNRWLRDLRGFGIWRLRDLAASGFWPTAWLRELATSGSGGFGIWWLRDLLKRMASGMNSHGSGTANPYRLRPWAAPHVPEQAPSADTPVGRRFVCPLAAVARPCQSNRADRFYTRKPAAAEQSY